MRTAIVALVMIVAAAAVPGAETFTGIITDNMCAKADHSQMRMGATDGDCAAACVDAHGAVFVLFDGRNAYTLSGDQKLEAFAGQKVTVTGTLDQKTQTIRVDSIALAK
jgi:hypothetical protein